MSTHPRRDARQAAADEPRARHEYARVGFVTTGRADAGLYESLIQLLRATGRTCLLFAGGTHHSERFGRTIDRLPRGDHIELVPVEHHVEGDRPVDVSASVGRAVEQFSRALGESNPDLLFVLGDRPEMLAAALAATLHRIPLAHLHGGEMTLGAYDDVCRHALTKLSHVHFAAHEQYAAEIRRMNEPADRIYVVGAPALDRFRGFVPVPRDHLSRAWGLDFARPTLVVLFHVETLSDLTPAMQASALLDALKPRSENLLVVGGNADVGHSEVGMRLREFADKRPNAACVVSLPVEQFWSCLAHASALVGNSSAGIIEAASFRLPVVNIGDRQTGRVRSANVIDVPIRSDEVSKAIDRALSPAYGASLKNLVNPFGDGRAAERIIAVLETLPPPAELIAKFAIKKKQ